MTARDLELWYEAQHTIWEEMDKLVEQCESEEARCKIFSLMKDRYHREND